MNPNHKINHERTKFINDIGLECSNSRAWTLKYDAKKRTTNQREGMQMNLSFEQYICIIDNGHGGGIKSRKHK